MEKILFILAAMLLASFDVRPDDGQKVLWASLGGESEAFDSMMEKAAFLDVPRRDLVGVAAKISPTSMAANRRQQTARIKHWQSWILAAEYPDSALTLEKSAIELCDSAQYPYDHLRFSIGLAEIYRMRGRLAEAYFICRTKTDILQSFGDRFWEAKSLVLIGRVMQDLNELHEAKWYFDKAQSIFLEIGSTSCATKNRINLANITYMLGEKEKSLGLLHNLELEECVASDSIYLANVLVSRFSISDCEDERAAVTAWEVASRLSNIPLSMIASQSMGKLMLIHKDYEKASSFLNKAYDLSVMLHFYPEQWNCLKGLEECYAERGLADSAAWCRDMIVSLNDSLYHLDKVESLRKQEHLATILRYENEIKESRQQHVWRQRVLICVGISLFLLLSGLSAILWLSRRKAEIDRRLQAEINERLSLENVQQRMEIEAKEKELTSNALLMAQNNTKLKELADKIREMESKGEIISTGGSVLSNTISDELSAEDDWHFFKLRFEEVYPEFFAALRDAFPRLSQTEERLCAYIRVGLTAKEMAQLMSVKPDTINTSRYRIRKKMQLGPTESLEQRLASL